MNKIKKTILTLVLLMTAATGAWAQYVDYDFYVDFNPYYNPNFTHFNCMIMSMDPSAEIKGKLDLSVDGVSKGSFDVNGEMVDGDIAAIDAGDHTYKAVFHPEGGGSFNRSGNFTIYQDFAYVYIDDPEQSSIEMGVGESRYFRGHVDGPESSEVNISSSNDNVAKFRASSSYPYGFEGYIDAVGAGTATITVSFAGNKNYKAAQSKTLTVTVLAPASSGPEVAWNKDEKTGTFTMPGGNVTLEPEYYPQATLAFQGLTAAEDAAAKTEAPLAVVADGAVTGGTLMYYVATDKNFSQADAIALAETQWSADIPTAETIDAAGTCYVWYYIKGDDEHSDTDPVPLAVTVLPEPTYTVEFAEGTPESGEWKAEPAAGVTKGQTVTVTYSGSKKVIGVKAEKKAAEPVADIVWDGTNVSDLHVEGNYLSYTKEGIKLSGNAEQVQAEWNNSAYLGTPGMEFITMESGGFTFTAPTGKAFTKIEMKAVGDGGWATENLGTGWAFNAKVFTVTWTGSAASTVKLLKDADMFSGDFISSIAFYLSE